MKINENQSKINENQWKSMKINENQWNQWKSMKWPKKNRWLIQDVPQNSLKTAKVLWQPTLHRTNSLTTLRASDKKEQATSKSKRQARANDNNNYTKFRDMTKKGKHNGVQRNSPRKGKPTQEPNIHVGTHDVSMFTLATVDTVELFNVKHLMLPWCPLSYRPDRFKCHVRCVSVMWGIF